MDALSPSPRGSRPRSYRRSRSPRRCCAGWRCSNRIFTPFARRRPRWRAPRPRRSTPRSRPARIPACSAGVPIGIKDLVATKDILTVMGSPLYKDFVPDEDDIVVERLKAAGAVIIGKTNVPEFGYSGVGHNPVSRPRAIRGTSRMTSGGSSAGSGASVAAASRRSPSAATAAARCVSPRRIAGCTASRRRWAAWRCIRAAATSLPWRLSWESLEHIGPSCCSARGSRRRSRRGASAPTACTV